MKVTRLFPLVSTIAILSGIAACSSAVEDFEAEDVAENEAAEAWDNANNPARVDTTFIYDVAALPTEGAAAQAPIPSDYWATARDSINARWDGDELSPAEKFGKAFNKGDVGLAVSKDTGIRGQTSRTECTTEGNECKDMKDGSSCSIPRGETKGRCLPSWWGICHGWAPYAFSEPVAKNPVTRNGVTFYAADVEALMSLVYSKDLPTKFLSSRCNRDSSSADDAQKVHVDASGRVIEGECRDMNPGSFHVVATNMLGLRKRSFVEDRTFDDQVWNQPVRDFKITNLQDGKLKEITKGQAAALMGINNLTFTEIQSAVTLSKGQTQSGVFTATVAGEHTFRTAGTGDADFFVRNGQEASASAFDCKSEGGTSVEECKLTLAVGDTVHFMLLGYSDASTANVSAAPPATNEVVYTFNTNAKRFFHVTMNFRYISEPRPTRTPADPDANTVADNYEYILEADEAGKIVGGEWLAASRENHPDFVWWPTAKPAGTRIAGGLITYAEVKSLNDEAAGFPAPTAVSTTLLTNATLEASERKYLTIGVASGAKLDVTMTGTGTAKLLVRLGQMPTTRVFDCRGTGEGANKTCSLTAPAGGGSYFIRVQGGPASNVTVVATTR